jgi:hypothetical protein
MLLIILLRAWIRELILYSVLKNSTLGSEYAFSNQKIIIALKSRFKYIIFLIFRKYP